MAIQLFGQVVILLDKIIELNNVTFEYESDEKHYKVLKDFSPSEAKQGRRVRSVAKKISILKIFFFILSP